MREIISMRFGSHLYGTATPASDADFKSVYVPEAREILLGRVKSVISTQSKSDPAARNTAGDVDRETFALGKYLGLVCEGQTVALDMLFAPESAWLSEPDPLWFEIFQNRDKLLSKRCQAFIGYCRQQANKYGIKGSRMAAARRARDYFEAMLPTHGHVKLSEFAPILSAMTDDDQHIDIVTILTGAERDRPLDHFDCCGRKVSFTQTVRQAFDVYSRLFAEYGKRALAAEQNEGIDWKALSHAVRVGEQAVELLETGFVTFPRPSAEHLVRIKTGQLPYSMVAAEIETLLLDVERAAEASKLPDRPDTSFCDDMVLSAHRAQVVVTPLEEAA
jgi:hypothetical protein